MKEHDIGSGREAADVIGQFAGCYLTGAPVTGVVVPQHHGVAERLSDLHGCNRVAAMRRTKEFAGGGIRNEPIERCASAQDLVTYLCGVQQIQVGMRLRMICDLVATAFDSLRELGPLLRIVTDQEKCCRNLQRVQLVQQQRRKNGVWTVVECERDQLRPAGAAAVQSLFVYQTLNMPND